MPPICYDLVIIGAGIAGLRVGIETLKKYKDLRCCIIEKYNYNGGRVVTYRKKIHGVGDVQWENGAGRISESHFRIRKLIREHGLSFVRISPDTDFLSKSDPIPFTNSFSNLLPIFLEPLSYLSQDELQKNTLGELLGRLYGKEKAKEFYQEFPYYAEIHTLRADSALQSFQSEMQSNKGFGVCAEGLSTLISKMVQQFTNLGGTIYHNTELNSVTTLENGSIKLNCKNIQTSSNIFYIANTCVIALHHSAIKKINGINKIGVLKHLQMEPLLRVYAVFPKINGKVWFNQMHKIVTDSRIRYIIPINQDKGTIMISYTDGADAEFWMKAMEKSGEKSVERIIMSEIRRLFSDSEIPNPIFFKFHPWYDGCTYWLPGRYSIEDESDKSLQPLKDTIPNLFMCGESFAVKQCWMESALEQADKLIKLPAYNKQVVSKEYI